MGSGSGVSKVREWSLDIVLIYFPLFLFCCEIYKNLGSLCLFTVFFSLLFHIFYVFISCLQFSDSVSHYVLYSILCSFFIHILLH